MGKKDSEKTHCPANHPYDEANTYVDTDGARRCRICARAGAAERTRRWKAKDPERARRVAGEYRERHRDRLRVVNRERMQDRRGLVRAEVLRVLGGCCTGCGFDDARALQVDHVNDDGSVDRLRFGGREAPNNVKFYLAVIAEASSGRYQLLCANCNTIKEAERRLRIRGDEAYYWRKANQHDLASPEAGL